MLFSDNQAESFFEELMAGLAGGGGEEGSPALSSLPRHRSSASRVLVDKIPAARARLSPEHSPLFSLPPAAIILACVRLSDPSSMQSLRREKNFTFLKFPMSGVLQTSS